MEKKEMPPTKKLEIHKESETRKFIKKLFKEMEEKDKGDKAEQMRREILELFRVGKQETKNVYQKDNEEVKKEIDIENLFPPKKEEAEDISEQTKINKKFKKEKREFAKKIKDITKKDVSIKTKKDKIEIEFVKENKKISIPNNIELFVNKSFIFYISPINKLAREESRNLIFYNLNNFTKTEKKVKLPFYETIKVKKGRKDKIQIEIYKNEYEKPAAILEINNIKIKKKEEGKKIEEKVKENKPRIDKKVNKYTDVELKKDNRRKLVERRLVEKETIKKEPMVRREKEAILGAIKIKKGEKIKIISNKKRAKKKKEGKKEEKKNLLKELIKKIFKWKKKKSSK